MKPDNLWEEFLHHVRNEGLSELRIKKLHVCYNILTRHLDLSTAERPEIQDYTNKLNDNKIRKVDGSLFSGNTKQDLKKFLKQFYKWYKGENEFYPPAVAWLKTRIPKHERPEEKPVI